MALPAISEIRAELPKVEFHVAAGRPWDEFFSIFDWCSGTERIWRGGGVRGFLKRMKSAAGLRGLHCDACVIFPNSFGSALEMRFAGLPVRVGYAWFGRKHLLTVPVRAVPEVFEVHQVLYYLYLAREFLRAFGIETAGDGGELSRRPPAPGIHLSDSFLEDGRRLLLESGLEDPVEKRPIIFAPGAAYGPAKEWPREHFTALAAMLYKETGGKTVLVGGAGEAEACREISESAGGAVVSLAGRTGIRQLAAVLSWARVYVGNDSGASHLAAALKLPTLVLFGSTKMTHTVPLGSRVKTLNLNLDCSPCMKRRCPLSHRNCLRKITPEMAFEALSGWL